jgi:1-acyl-sn-glycerol-3-phosphate acyltransferase
MTARRFFNKCLRFAFWVALRLKVEDARNIPARGPTILMINHTNFLDPFVVVASMPREVTAMSKIENFSIPVLGWIFKWYGAIPVRRGEADRRALKEALDVLKTDTLLLIAPEGTRSPNRALQSAHDGLAYIGHRSQALIVPVAITGAPDFSHNIRRLRRTPVNLQVGQPFSFHIDGRRLEREAMTAMTNEAMYQLAALLPPENRGIYADLEQATENYIQFPEGSVSNLPAPDKPDGLA